MDDARLIGRKGGAKWGKLKKFLVVHKNPNIRWKKMEENWAKLANVETATWMRSGFNKKAGVRYCLWPSPDAEDLKKNFEGLDVDRESFLEVEETVPDLWGGQWEDHL